MTLRSNVQVLEVPEEIGQQTDKYKFLMFLIKNHFHIFDSSDPTLFAEK